LRDAIPRVLSDALAAELATPRVLTSRQSASLDFDYRVAVDVQHFESTATEASEDVIWTIRTRGSQPARVGRTVVTEPAAGGLEGLAAAHSRALARVAQDIARAIRETPAR
ncbi:MAG TPA: ABC-type transport auxiliary lipoprotein family protein, partial [Usitatibacter sp.]|nr:ABC-type transport auxiliary lipoprotein family protein [Usitatibacter sp.]